MESRFLDLLTTHLKAWSKLCSWKAKMVNNSEVKVVRWEVSWGRVLIQNSACAHTLHNLTTIPQHTNVLFYLLFLIEPSNIPYYNGKVFITETLPVIKTLLSRVFWYNNHRADFSSLKTKILWYWNFLSWIWVYLFI